MSAVIFCAFAAVITRKAARSDCIFLLLVAKLSATVAPVEVVTTGATFTTAATVYAACG